MNNIAKVLLGLGAVGIVAGITYAVAKKSENKYTVVKPVNKDATPDEEVYGPVEEPSVIDRIKEAAYKKAVKIIGWVIVNKDQVEAIGTIISVMAAVFSVVNAIRDFTSSIKLRKDLDHLIRHSLEAQETWDENVRINNANRKTYERFMNDTYDKLEAIHLDMSMLHEIHESLVEVPKPKRKGA